MQWDAIAPGESAAQLLARAGADRLGNVGIAAFEDGLEDTDVVELYGSEGTGKSELVLHAVVSTILPRAWDTQPIGGLEAGAVLLDVDLKFSFPRLLQLIQLRAQAAVADVLLAGGVLDCAVKAITRDALSRLHVARVTDSSELVATLHTLEPMIRCDPSIRLVAIDSISAFHWLGRSRAGDSTALRGQSERDVATAVKLLQSKCSVAIIVTKAAFFLSAAQPRANAAVGHREYMAQEWRSLVTQRYVLTRTAPASATTLGWAAQRQLPDPTAELVPFNITDGGIEWAGAPTAAIGRDKG